MNLVKDQLHHINQQSLGWTTGLSQTAKYTLFRAEPKLHVLIHFDNTAPYRAFPGVCRV